MKTKNKEEETLIYSLLMEMMPKSKKKQFGF